MNKWIHGMAMVLVFAATAAQVSALPPTYADDFDRADGALGADWSQAGSGSLTISNNQACSPAGGQAVNLWSGTASAANEINAFVDIVSSGGAPRGGIIVGSLAGDPRYVRLGIIDVSSSLVLRIESGVPGSSPDTICATGSPLQLSANVAYTISAVMQPDGSATVSVTDDLGPQQISCSAGDHNYNRLVLFANPSSGTPTCMDNFAFFGELAETASCTDMIKNGDESDVDCGGSCDPCGTGQSCTGDADCSSGSCTLDGCAAPSCHDGVQNGTETAEDCGGSCRPCDMGCGVPDSFPCITAAKNALIVGNKNDDTKDKLQWIWKGGDSFTHDASSDPTVDGWYELCVTNSSSDVLFHFVIPPAETCGDDKPCWKEKAGKSYAFKDKNGTQSGIKTLNLASGAQGKAKIAVKASGADLDDIDTPISDPLLTVRLHDRSSGMCWESTFDSTSLKKNGDEGFTAKK